MAATNRKGDTTLYSWVRTINVALGLLLTAATITIAVPQARSWLVHLGDPHAGYRVGETIDLPSAAFASADRTLFVFAQSGCAACQAAAPFFNRVATMARDIGHAKIVFVATNDARSEAEEYGHRIGVDIQSIVMTDDRRTRVRVVPTLLVTDRHGRVRLSHEGAPVRPDDEAVLLESVYAALLSD